MKLKNLNQVYKLKEDLANIDKEIACVCGERKGTVSFSVLDRQCGQSWFKERYLNKVNRVKMSHLIIAHLKEIRQEILKELISLGVEP